jgi:hypothetical protein
MPTLEHDKLVFRFPHIDQDADFSIDFQRTLRIPDSEITYPLPPGLGSFPLRHSEDYKAKLPEQTGSRGGVILPMWQAEAMWLHFGSGAFFRGLDFPVAVKVAAGKINAVTGEPWRPGLHRDPQDYLVAPRQPWLDGFAVEKGVVRQFVAMPLGEGYSAEEQITGEPEWGGLQISVMPLKAEIWKAKKAEWEAEQSRRPARRGLAEQAMLSSRAFPSMGLAPGGRMEQDIYPDPFRIDDWDIAAADRVFITLVHAKDWREITGEPAPSAPPTAKEYTEAGLPWFEYYGKDQQVLPGSATLAGMMSVGALFKKFTGATMSGSGDVNTGKPKAIGPSAQTPRPLRTAGSWEH